MIPARSCSTSGAGLGTASVTPAKISVGEATGDGEEDGMVWATLRKKSSMYWSEAGSYYELLDID